jgi:hypothetical protein
MRVRRKLAGGGVFVQTDRTLVVPVADLALSPPAEELLVGPTLAVLVPATGLPWRVPPTLAVDTVDQANARRVAAGLPVLELPADYRRVARHAALAPAVELPWPAADALGFPGRTPATTRTTLWVHRSRGDCVLATDDTVLSGSFRQRATTPTTWRVERVTRRQAVQWLARHGYAVPPVLVSGGRTDEMAADGGAGDV